MEEAQSIIKLDKATQLLAEVKNVDDAKDIINLAEAARVYAKQIKLGLEAQNHAAEIKLRAQRKAGELLDGMEKAKGGQPYQSTGDSVIPVENNLPTYSDMDIAKRDAAQWQTIAKMPEEEFEQTLEQAKARGKEITTAGIYREARRAMAQDKPVAPPLPDDKYHVIYADPPWSYDNTGFDQSAAAQYPTMSTEELCDLPVADLAGEPCVLFLWATSPLLPEALQVMQAWGFEYKAGRVWVKDKGPTIGWWINTRHEHLLIGTRNGNAHPDEKLDSIIKAPVTKHSQKPAQVYSDIERAYPGRKKIELFARNLRPGWESWGNEDVE